MFCMQTIWRKNGKIQYRIALFLLVLFLAAPAGTAAAAEIDFRIVAADGARVDFVFDPEITSYTITLTEEQAAQFSVAAPGWTILDSDENKESGSLSETYEIRDGTRLTFQLQSDSGNTSYTFRFRIVALPDDESDTPQPIQPAEPSQPEQEAETPQQPQEEEPPALDPLPEEELLLLEEELEETDGRLHIQMNIGLAMLFVNDTPQALDTAPFLYLGSDGNGHTMVPVRCIAEAFGAVVDWNALQRRVAVTLGGETHILEIDKPPAGQAAPACIRDSRTFVPLRYIMESFGAEVLWTAREQRVDIWYEPPAS